MIYTILNVFLLQITSSFYMNFRISKIDSRYIIYISHAEVHMGMLNVILIMEMNIPDPSTCPQLMLMFNIMLVHIVIWPIILLTTLEDDPCPPSTSFSNG